jgi:hypothetical protein
MGGYQMDLGGTLDHSVSKKITLQTVETMK